MDFIAQNWLLLLALLVSGGMLLWPALSGGQGIAVQEAIQKMNREKALFIDVRSQAEYAQEHIAQAKLLPLDELGQRLEQTAKNKALPLIFVCATGPRAVRAAQMARSKGYEHCFVMRGGMRDWRAANLPVVGA